METKQVNAAVDPVRRADMIKKASLIAIFGNLALAVAKVSVGLMSGSLAVVGDGIDTSVDVIISGMTLFVSRIIAKPADASHPWGHGKAETVATAGLSFILFFAGAQLFVNAASSVFSNQQQEIPDIAAIIVTVISIAGKLLLALNQYFMGKKASSAMLVANAKNMAGDVIISAAVLVGLGLTLIFKLAILDTIAAMLVALWVIKAAIGIFLEANTELMDGGSPKEKYQEVFEAVRSVPGACNPHRARIRRIAGFWDISIDIEVDGNLTVFEAHLIATCVEYQIRDKLQEAVYDIMIHVEPSGDGQEDHEAYGLTEENLGE